ncbi:alpha-1B adrenergic receptor-like [Asterias rubens]|uniref:alpha-1B adrenergic receptor-like n=1 Tax=Asterias rubens TaxID=7604 RepID=UPI00145519D8|nr:alpha-1B adrenergic receptor-like [Asterias rubens]
MAATTTGQELTSSSSYLVTYNDTGNTGYESTPFYESTSPGTNDDYDGEFKFDDYTQRCIVSGIFIVVCIVGTFGNGLVILAVLLSRKLRTVTNVFVVNLAAADLLVCFVLPWNAVGLLTKPGDGWPLPDQLCVAVALISFTCVGCSLYTLATIAINRWMLITRPSKTYRTCYTPAYLAAMIVIVWLVPFLVAFVPPRFGLGALGYTEKYSTCTHKNAHALAMYYSLLQSVVLFPVPFVIIIVSYVKIFKHVKQHTKVMKDQSEMSAETSNNRDSTHESVNTRDSAIRGTSKSDLSPRRPRDASVIKKRLSRRQVEITKNLFYVVCAFTICIVPYGVALLIPPSDPVIPWTGALLVINSCINPIIYATKHPYFKQVFRLMLGCQCGKIPEQSNFLRSVRSTVRRT